MKANEDELRRKIALNFTERRELAMNAWEEYRSVNPFPQPERMPAQFHAGFTLGMAAGLERTETKEDHAEH